MIPYQYYTQRSVGPPSLLLACFEKKKNLLHRNIKAFSNFREKPNKAKQTEALVNRILSMGYKSLGGNTVN